MQSCDCCLKTTFICSASELKISNRFLVCFQLWPIWKCLAIVLTQHKIQLNLCGIPSIHTTWIMHQVSKLIQHQNIINSIAVLYRIVKQWGNQLYIIIDKAKLFRKNYTFFVKIFITVYRQFQSRQSVNFHWIYRLNIYHLHCHQNVKCLVVKHLV